ncbi:DNA recombination protein RmuC [soil metagenome]
MCGSQPGNVPARWHTVTMDPVLTILIVVAIGIAAIIALQVAILIRSNWRGTSGAQSDGSLAIRQDLSNQRAELSAQLLSAEQVSRQSASDLKREVLEQLATMRDGNDKRLENIRVTVDSSLKENAEKVDSLRLSAADRSAELQRVVREELDKMREGNETKLEQMRATVDEKLQGTLEKRLGESFSLVSSRLEEVQKGLGEMQNLAQDVGGLKRVLTNVKNRGTWGEVQLQRQLEDTLAPDQFEANVAIKPGSAERVEFAVRLPGQSDDGGKLYLPIDSKFPHEDYERLLEAQETGEKALIDVAGANLERAIIEQAKSIAKKYIEPPYSTDFAIMYLPTEGLFAEVARRPGLANRLQNMHRIQVTGPTTLSAFLGSLQLGFRTLAIEKRSSEVWQVLAAAKQEFQKHSQVWARLEKQLQTAQNTVAEGGRRSRAVERTLRTVESAPGMIAPESLDDDQLELDLQAESSERLEVITGELSSLDEIDGVSRPEFDLSPPTAAMPDEDTKSA